MSFKYQSVYKDSSVCAGVGEKGHLGEFPGEKGDKEVPGVMGYKGEKGRAREKGNIEEKGHKGDVGPSGPMGLRGSKGTKGGPWEFPGEKGNKGFSGQKGSKGDAGSDGVTHIRWGRTVCPRGTSLLYTRVTTLTSFITSNLPSKHNLHSYVTECQDALPYEVQLTPTAWGTKLGNQIHIR